MAVTETRIVTKRLREFTEDSWTIDRYLATGGYEQLRRALTMEPVHIQDEQVKASGPARPRRRRLRHRPEVVVPAEGHLPAVPRRERRRG